MDRFRTSPRALARSFGGEVLLATPDREEIDRLTGTAAAVWHSLRAPVRVSDLVEDLAADFGTTGEAITADVEGLLDQLTSRGLVDLVTDDRHGDEA